MSVAYYVSGVEPAHHRKWAYDAGNRNMLMSYLWITKMRVSLDEIAKTTPGIRWMIDSGAHTMQTSMDKAPYKTWTVKDFENYVQEYVKWLHDNFGKYKCAVELDIAYSINIAAKKKGDDPYGDYIVEEWRKKLFQPLISKGAEIIFVWHASQGLEGWERLCATYPYVGLPGEMSSQQDFNSYLTVARRYTTRVHAFAGTKQSDFRDWPWYSLDSSVTGDSVVTVMDAKGKVRRVQIGALFDEHRLFARRTTRTEEIADTPALTVLTVDDELKSVYLPLKAVVKHTVSKPLYRITTIGGKTITGTGDHSFFKLTRAGKLVEVTPEELRVGDYIVGSANTAASKPVRSLGLAAYMLEFMGYYFGDGHVTVSQQATVISKLHQPEMRALAQRVADTYVHALSVKANGIDGSISCAELSHMLVTYLGRIGAEKRIPDSLLSAPLEEQAAFLRGYFSADGSAKGAAVSLSCQTAETMRTVQAMLEQWDIRANYGSVASVGGYKPHTSHRLTICDTESLANFQRHIGFIQEEQRTALAKNLTPRRYSISRGRRGLPVSLRKDKEWIYQSSGKRFRPTPRQQKLGQDSLNFNEPLLAGGYECLTVSKIELVSDGKRVEVFDLCVPGVQRYVANGILAHNTSWKAGEMYGTLPHWFEKRQKLKFLRKEEREIAREDYIRWGLDADKIIQDLDYQQVTFAALKSYADMEKFYQELFSKRTFYYELRLPYPKVFLRRYRKPQKVLRCWKRFSPEKTFPSFAEETSVDKIRSWLHAIACVQYRDPMAADKEGMRFLQTLFPANMAASPVDSMLLAREMSTLIAPANEAVQRRMSEDDYAANSNPPKRRTERLEDIEEETFPEWLEAELAASALELELEN